MDINEILSGLSAEDMDSLKQAASALMSGSDLSGIFDVGQEEKQFPQNVKSEQNTGKDSGFDLEAFGKIASLMSSFGKGNDPRCQLIMSLKPMLSPERQKKADEAVKILHLIDMIPALRDSGLLRGVL